MHESNQNTSEYNTKAVSLQLLKSPRRLLLLCFLSIGAVLGSILLGILLAGTIIGVQNQDFTHNVSIVTATARPNVIQYRVYNDPNSDFSLKYPDGWTATIATLNDSITSTTFTAPDNPHIAFMVMVQHASSPLTLADMATVITDYSGTTFKLRQTVRSNTINGINWSFSRASFVDTASAHYSMRGEITAHASTTYLVVEIAPATRFATENQTVFMTMLRSTHLLAVDEGS